VLSYAGAGAAGAATAGGQTVVLAGAYFGPAGTAVVAMRKDLAARCPTTVPKFFRYATHIEEIIEHTDIIQVGAKAMYDQGILRACAKIKKPVLIKRGFGTTLQEFVQAAEFVLSGGNENVVLCERGIRTFETGTRFTLDLCGVAWLQEHSNLPIVLDPSHAMGYAYGVNPLARACVAMGIDGLLIEAHPNPKVAKSDASQQLNYDEFRKLHSDIQKVAQSVGYQIV
jgi:3-deoxy-7-phosphoheptulonate synthase